MVRTSFVQSAAFLCRVWLAPRRFPGGPLGSCESLPTCRLPRTSENTTSSKIHSCQTPLGLGNLSMFGRALHRQPGVGSPQPTRESAVTGCGAAPIRMELIAASYQRAVDHEGRALTGAVLFPQRLRDPDVCFVCVFQDLLLHFRNVFRSLPPQTKQTSTYDDIS